MPLMHVIAENRFWNTQCNITHGNARSVQENSTAVRAQTTSRLIFCYYYFIVSEGMNGDREMKGSK